MVHPLTAIAQGLTMEYFGNSLRVGRYFLYSPKGKANKGKGRPIKVTGGQFMSGGRLSNRWTWHYIKSNGSLGEKADGYGGKEDFFKPITRREAVELAKK